MAREGEPAIELDLPEGKAIDRPRLAASTGGIDDDKLIITSHEIGRLGRGPPLNDLDTLGEG